MAHEITYVDTKSNKKANIELIRGDTLILTLTFNRIFDDNTVEPYEPEEGDLAIFTLRSNYKGLANDEILVQKEVDLFNDPTLMLEPLDTETLPYGSYKYDIQFTSVGGVVDTPLIGIFKLAKEVT